ncbi:MAG: flippase-like domain-containing protein [Phycisphaerae bacterium]|nr:flippase-like domain-containing protein [Phycisphaerae bacterium]
MQKKVIKNLVWLAVALTAIIFLASRIDRKELVTILKSTNWSIILLAIPIQLAAQVLLGLRWLMLLKPHKVDISPWQTIKLTYLGFFYNSMMPGAVGGDLLKAWYIRHHSKDHQKVAAVVTVFVDRIVGLVAMICVASIAGIFAGDELVYTINSRTFHIRWFLWGILLIMIIGSAIALCKPIRKRMMLSGLLKKLPFASLLQKAEQAINVYRSHIKTIGLTFLMTVVIQSFSIVAIWLLALSLGFEKVTFLQCFIIMPIIWVISSAIPIPGGLGVSEGLIIFLFGMVIDPSSPQTAHTDAAALAVLVRILGYAASLPGGLVPIFGGHLPKASEMQDELEQ